MIKSLLTFFALWAVFLALLSTWRRWTPKDAWRLGKTILVAGAAALASAGALALFVYLF
jgi:hypothetical protein